MHRLFFCQLFQSQHEIQLVSSESQNSETSFTQIDFSSYVVKSQYCNDIMPQLKFVMTSSSAHWNSTFCFCCLNYSVFSCSMLVFIKPSPLLIGDDIRRVWEGSWRKKEGSAWSEDRGEESWLGQRLTVHATAVK